MLDWLFLGLKLLAEKNTQDLAKIQIKNEYREISKMDVWDGIETQLEEHLKFYNKEQYPWYKASVYWKGDQSKLIQINRIELQINRDYWDSGLSMEDFCKKYFKELQDKDIEYKYGGSTESYFDFNLYDQNGIPANVFSGRLWDKESCLLLGLTNEFSIKIKGQERVSFTID